MNIKYKKVTPQTIEKLEKIIGKENISIKKHEIENYSIDESTFAHPSAPELIVKPKNKQMVSEILKFANENLIPVTPRGAGTGVSGGCIPIYGGILLSLERLNKILKIDNYNFTAVVEAGVSLSHLDENLSKYNLYYPIHLGDMSATLGGNVATNAGGMNAVKYGVTRHHILGLEVVLATGEIITTGGEYVKCSTGYDITQLLVGSEGTLAIITTIILRLLPRPANREILFIPFGSLKDAIDTVPRLLTLETIPVGIEFFDKETIQIIQKYMNIEVPYHDQEAFLMIILEGESSEEIIKYFTKVELICREHNAIDFFAPDDTRSKRKLIEMREKIQPAIKRAGKSELIDAIVPRNRIAEFVKKVKIVASEFKIPLVTFGHAGDGNVHIHPICTETSDIDWHHKVSVLMENIYRIAISLGGTISGEHGIGMEKKQFIPLAFSEEKLALMRRIKKTFEPWRRPVPQTVS